MHVYATSLDHRRPLAHGCHHWHPIPFPVEQKKPESKARSSNMAGVGPNSVGTSKAGPHTAILTLGCKCKPSFSNIYP